DGRTGCDGSGRGPPIGACGRGYDPGRAGVAGRGAPAPGLPGRCCGGADLLRFPVAGGGGLGGCGGRTSSGRRGGAWGAGPVFGSWPRGRSVGGTTRPGIGAAGRGAAGAATAAAAGTGGGSTTGGSCSAGSTDAAASMMCGGSATT